MALVHSHRGELPEKWALLYEDAVDILLQHWDKRHPEGVVPPLQALLNEVKRDFNALKEVLERLVFETHATGAGLRTPEDSGPIDEWKLLRGLCGPPSQAGSRLGATAVRGHEITRQPAVGA